MNIKETKELFKGCEVIAETLGAVLKDGKVNMADLALLPELAMDFGVFKDAAKDASLILEEMKDLKEEEILEIVMCAYAVAKAFNDAKRS